MNDEPMQGYSANADMPVDRGRVAARATEAVEQARSTVRNVGRQAREAAANAGAAAQDLARRAREQASSAGGTLNQQGARAGEYVTRNVHEYPVAALLIAGAIGYGIAFLIHSRRGAE